MRSYAVALLAGLIVVVVADEFYEGKWNSFDTKAIIGNVRLRNLYAECLLGKRTTGCPPEALELKKILLEGLKTTCAKCSTIQQGKIKEILEELCKLDPKLFKELLTAFDPNNEYRPAFEKKFEKLDGNC